MHKKLYILYIIAGCFLVTSAPAQDLGALKGQKPFLVHGGIGAGLNFYSSNESYPTRDPFSWNVFGSLSPSFYGLALPFSFVITQYSKSYTTPFAQFGISPSYKWIRLHLGYRNISFSPLVFDGQSFLGGGIELTPKNFYFGAFYGRLNKAVSEDTTLGHILEPQYARRAYGFKIGAGGSRENFSIQFFHAKDDTGSIHRLHDSLTSILPVENSVIGGSWHFQFFKKLTFTGDAAVSLFNRDLSYEEIDSIGNVKIPRMVQNIASLNYSTVFSYSCQGQMMLTLQNFNASAGYRRIQPDFQSLGVPYALNDVEMFSGNLGTSLYRGKVSLSATYNGQHNDLSHMLTSSLQTHTGNLGINAFLNQHLNVNLNITGVQVYQANGALKLNDSIRMNQLMWNAVLSPVINFSDAAHQHTLSLSLAYTELDDHNPATKALTGCTSTSSSLNYSLFFTRSFWGLNGSILYNGYQQLQNSYQSFGVNVGISAALMKDQAWGVQGSLGYFFNHDTGAPAGNNTTFSFSSSYAINQQHSFSFFMSYVITPPVNLNPLNIVNRVPIAVNSKNLSGGLMYAFHF